MRLLKQIFFVLVLSVGLNANTKVQESIVKIYTVAKIPSYTTPWNTTIRRSSGSGAIIDGERILTNAHVVANETFIEVKRNGDTKRYEAKVEYISHQSDLAILTIVDKNFFEGTSSLDFGDLPKTRQEITVFGFPIGGNSISVSTGIVSRIEHNSYAHSGERFLAIQIDAAVNPGSSGGPAISDGKIVGVVMQQISKSQSIGYIIPVEIVKHFLDDIKDKKLDGYPHLGISTGRMENKALRDVYKMDEKSTGALIIEISQKSPAFDKLKVGDVLLSIDSHKVQNDATVEFIPHKFTSYKYYIDKKQIGDTIVMEVLRDSKKIKIEFVLTNIADDNLLVHTVAHDVMPKYLIYGGYTFSPLTRNILKSTRARLLPLRQAARQWATDDKEEVVILLKVLADKMNRGDHNFSLWIVDKVDDKEFKNFTEFLSLVKNFKGKYLILKNKDGVTIAIDRQEAKAVEKSILKRYSIKSSEEL